MATSILGSSLATTAQSNLMQSREDHLLNQLGSDQNHQDDARIEKGAKEFESMLLSTWLQQAEKSMATVPGGDDDEDAAGRDQMMGLGVQALSTSMVASGGIGIASMIAKAMHATSAKQSSDSDSTAASANAAKIDGKN